MRFISAEKAFLNKTTTRDKEGNRTAKCGLSDKDREKLLDMDEVCFMTKGEHLVCNFEELELYA